MVGSLNLDLVYDVEELPAPGETVLGSRLREFSGGKGGNQAHAAARTAASGTTVAMVACVGPDAAGARLRDDLAGAGAEVSAIREVDAPSGLALIAVDRAGENTIVVIPGANGAWPADPLEGIDLGRRDVVVCQCEIPMAVVEATVVAAAAAGARVVLNAAPADRGVLNLLDRVDVLVVNEGEMELLFGAGATDAASVAAVRSRIAGDLVVTLGRAGAIVAERAEGVAIPAFAVDAIDTVGAGDAFVGGLAAALAAGETLLEAVRFGSAAGALTATIEGARHPELTRNRIEELRGSKV